MKDLALEEAQENIRALKLIHFFLTLLLPVGLFLLLGCTEDPEVKKADLGPEVSVDQVNKVMDEALASRSPTETRVGDKVLYEINQRVETSSIIRLKEVLLDVKSRSEDNEFIVYLLDEATTDYQGDTPDTVQKEVEWRIAKTNLPELPPASLYRATLWQPLQSVVRPPSLFAKDTPVTFHNLSITKGVRPAPPAVAESADCRGLSPCQLNVAEVNFDLVEWPSPDDWKVTKYRYIYSSDTPYPAHLILLCVKTLVDTEARDYFVSQCQVLRDFIGGAK
ncbi:MAG: hypothetical protein IT288_01870 [Bdellovibrionales bacterium]|nr:hypothetical protein [Bdellovibrionales bacterium]